MTRILKKVRAALASEDAEDATKESLRRKWAQLELAVRQIVSRAISSDKVIDIFDAAGLKKPDISILSDEFLAGVRSRARGGDVKCLTRQSQSKA